MRPRLNKLAMLATVAAISAATYPAEAEHLLYGRGHPTFEEIQRRNRESEQQWQQMRMEQQLNDLHQQMLQDQTRARQDLNDSLSRRNCSLAEIAQEFARATGARDSFSRCR